MKKLFAVFLAFLFLSACSTQQPIQDIVSSPIPLKANGSMLTHEEIKHAIFAAAEFKRWTPSSTGDSIIDAHIVVRKRHEATVEIKYSQREYSIRLKNSVGLDQNAGKIHRNYNKWITLLNQQIQLELAKSAI